MEINLDPKTSHKEKVHTYIRFNAYYGTSSRLPPIFETNQLSPTLSNHGINRNIIDNIYYWMTHKYQPDAYTEDLCNINCSSQNSINLANGYYNTYKPSIKSQRLFLFTSKILSTQSTHTITIFIDV